MEPTTSKTSKAEAPPEATSAKRSKTPKRQNASKPSKRQTVENPVVFAFRLSEAERTRIHDAAGGGKASQFVLGAALAAADGDVEAFKKIVGTRAMK